MKKAYITFLFLILAIGCINYSPRFCPESIITRVRQHTVSIATYFVLEYEVKVILGSGTVLKNDHIITVRHLFDDRYDVPCSYIYVFFEGVDKIYEADIVAISTSGNRHDDYAILKLRESVGLPGLKIATKQPKLGDKVIYTGSMGGLAFFTRFGFVTKLQQYFKRGTDGYLHLALWENFPYQVVFPGGGGDSGGSICNITKGEITGIMYFGISAHYETYIFSNPLVMIWEFLAKHNLEYLGR